MLGKLIKYELRASYRKFLPIMAGVIILSAIIALLNFEILETKFIAGILFLIAYSLGITLLVLIIVTIINRFSKGIYGKEGYLVHTLPVSAFQIVLSKIITSIVWILLSMATVVIGLFLIFLRLKSELDVDMLINIIKTSIEQNLPAMNLSGWIVLVNMIISAIAAISSIYFAISVSKMTNLRKFSNAIAIIIYFILQFVTAFITNKIAEPFIDNITMGDFDLSLMISICVNIVFFIIYLFSTSVIVEKKLDLE